MSHGTSITIEQDLLNILYMSLDPNFKLAISSNTSTYERELLLSALRSVATIQTPEYRTFGIDDYIVIVTVVGKTAGTLVALAKLAEQINTWRRNARERGVQTEGKLQRPGQSPLDLKSATDEEIQEWVQRQ